MRKLIIFVLLVAGLTSCGEYQRVLKSSDPEVKFEYAKRAYEEKRYVQAYTLLREVVGLFKGSDKAEEALYLLGLSHYDNKEWLDAASIFHSYYTRYPRGKFTELARFYSGYAYYNDSPEPQLDQSGTLKAIEELQAFLDYFPRSERVGMAQNAIFEMQDKLTLKELQNAQLYYNLGNYLGNNYESAIIVAQNALKEYPYSRYKEDLELLVLKSKFQIADQSIEEKKRDRFLDVIDEYYSFINNWPDTPNRAEADNIMRIAQNHTRN